MGPELWISFCGVAAVTRLWTWSSVKFSWSLSLSTLLLKQTTVRLCQSKARSTILIYANPSSFALFFFNIHSSASGFGRILPSVLTSLSTICRLPFRSEGEMCWCRTQNDAQGIIVFLCHRLNTFSPRWHMGCEEAGFISRIHLKLFRFDFLLVKRYKLLSNASKWV